MAGTIVETFEKRGPIGVITLVCTADAADGSYPAQALATKISGRIISIETDPGATAPTTLYDVVLTDAQSYDVAQGLLANRSATVTERAHIVYSGLGVSPEVTMSDVLTWTITNNSENSALITAKIYVEGQLEG